MYKIPVYRKTKMRRTQKVEGESIEQKVGRLLKNKEPIKDGAPLIFTEAKDGVQSAYNIRTDRWEVATDAMDLIAKSKQAKRDERLKNKANEPKVIKMDSEAESTQGKADEKSQSK